MTGEVNDLVIEKRLKEEELAARFQVTVSTVQRWRRAGKGPSYIKIDDGNSAVRYRMDDVLAWEESRLVVTHNNSKK